MNFERLRNIFRGKKDWKAQVKALVPAGYHVHIHKTTKREKKKEAP